MERPSKKLIDMSKKFERRTHKPLHVWKAGDKLSDHFTYGELTRSQTAVRRNIDNTPNQQQIENMISLCENVMEPVRVHFAKPVTPSSGFRIEELNEAIGGSGTSQHCKGEAVDFTVNSTLLSDVYEWIILKSGIEFDQVIYEFSNWIHISHKKYGENRMRCTVAHKVASATKYNHFTKIQIANGEHKGLL